MFRRPAPSRLARFVVEALEPRLLYSADLGPSLLGAVVAPMAEQRLLESEPQAPVQPEAPAAQTQSREVVFVDAATPDADRLIADIAAQPGRTIDVVRIGADEDGLARIGAELAARQDVSAVHIISHGSDGAVYLGRSVLDLQSLNARSGELAAWGGSLTPDADVLIYGCDVAQSALGQALVERLAAVTGADVAASTNLTGSAALGGDFNLEFRSGAVETQAVLNQLSTLDWQGLLDVTADTSSSAASNTPVTSLMFSHTVSASGSDGFLLVTVGTVNGAQSTTSVTYGGVALTRIDGITEATGKVSVELWGLKDPAAGTADVVVNIAGPTSISAGATTFFGVDQSTPYSATAFAQGGGGAVSVTLASAPGELVVDGVAAQAVSTEAIGPGQTELWSERTGNTPRDPWNASSTEAGAASVTMSWMKSGSGVGHWAQGALSLRAAVNVAPVLGGANDLGSIAEDAASNPGTPVSSLIAGHMTDANASALQGIAVMAVDNTNGTWQYSTDAGTSWSNFGAPSDTGARLLAADANTYIRFVPNADWNGTMAAGLTFRGWDRTTGIAGGTADASVNGGSTAFSTALASSGITVIPVNDAPAGVSNTVTTPEDTPYVFAAADFGFSDSDGNAFAAVKIGTLPGSGTLTDNGVAVAAGQGVSAADIAAGLLRFTPAPNANGAGYASFTFQVQDDGGTANGGVDLDPVARTLTVNVTAVNDAPSGASNTVTTLEDTAYVFAAGDFGFTDIDGNTLVAVKIGSLPGAGTLTDNGVAVSSGQSVSAADVAAGLLRFTPAPNANGVGYASFSFQVQDDGGTANGGVDLDPVAHTMTLNVTAVNDAPAGANNTVTTLEDTPYVFAASDFGFSDTDGNALLAVKISSLPAAGTLTNNGAAVSAGQTVSTADIAAGLLRFTPAANANGTGYASFTFQVQDDGGTANGGADLDPIARTMTVNVAAVNDAPSGASNTVTALEDGVYVFTAADFGFSDADGNAFAAVRIAAGPASGTLTDNGVAVTAGQTVSAADIATGLLRFTPAANASGAGYASFSFQVQDNGGTANGATDLDPIARTMTVNVTAVNDAPTGANNTVVVQQDGTYAFTTADFGFSDSDGNAFAGVVIAAVPPGGLITDNGAPVAAGQTVSAGDIAAGLVRYTPAVGVSGSTSFTFRVQDNGGTANGGADTDAVARTMTMNVIPASVGPTVGPVPVPAPPAKVQSQPPAPVAPAATNGSAVALTEQTAPAAGSARLLLASNDVVGTRIDADEGFRFQLAAAQPLASVFATAQRLTNFTPAAAPAFGSPASAAVSDEKQFEFQLFGSMPVSDRAGSGGSRAAGLAGDLDRMRDDLGEQADLHHWVSGSIAVGSFGLTVGYVLWLLRGGALLASLLSSLPAWRLIDPLPVLSRVDDEEDADEDQDGFVSFEEANLPFPVAPERS